MKETKFGFFSMGIPLLITALLVLMLVTFSLLGLSGAKNDLERAEQLASRSSEFCHADNQARQVLARLEAGLDPGVAVTREDGCLSYAIPLNDRQSLLVTLRQEDLAVLRWQTVND